MHRHLKAFLAFVAILPWLRSGAQTESTMMMIRVRVFNRSEVAARTVLSGESKAGELLGRATIDVVWLNCGPATPECFEPPSPTNLIMTMLNQGQAMGRGDALGLAVEDAASGGYCYVFGNKLNDLSRQTQIAPSRLLGYAMAHELGHLLKGSHSHSASGLMSARWSPHELQQLAWGGLEFTPQDAFQMRSRLSSLNLRVRSAASLSGSR